jgi:gamma-glutamylcysteine synthetase
MDRIKPYSHLLADAFENSLYLESFEKELAKVEDESLLFSSQILDSLSDDTSIIDVMGKLAKRYKTLGMEVKTDPQWSNIAAKSLAAQRSLESDTESFEDFHSRYFNEIKINFEDNNA